MLGKCEVVLRNCSTTIEKQERIPVGCLPAACWRRDAVQGCVGAFQDWVGTIQYWVLFRFCLGGWCCSGVGAVQGGGCCPGDGYCPGNGYCLGSQIGVKTLPCPKLRLRAVKLFSIHLKCEFFTVHRWIRVYHCRTLSTRGRSCCPPSLGLEQYSSWSSEPSRCVIIFPVK